VCDHGGTFDFYLRADSRITRDAQDYRSAGRTPEHACSAAFSPLVSPAEGLITRINHARRAWVSPLLLFDIRPHADRRSLKFTRRPSHVFRRPFQGANLNNFGFALVVALLRALARLPYGLVARFGSGLGALLYSIPSRRKHIVQVNLQLCFPGKTAAEYELLGRSHFRHVVRSYVERGVQWFGSARAIEKLVQLESRIDLDDENAQPTIFMGFHFVAIEVGCMLYSMKLPITALYTPMSSKRLNTLAIEQRGRFGADMVMRADSGRRILKLLRKGGSVMLAADMDHGIENSVFVPFFGVPACTLTSVSRLARLGGARVVPFVTEVLPDYKGYKMTIFEPLADFPSASDETDARRMNEFLESQIVRFPEQYYWVHRRFKHRPEGVAGVY
jgi:KDO2-lipid IV(A) lauroyltransferase